MPALQKKHKKSSVHNIKSVMNTRYGADEGTWTHMKLPSLEPDGNATLGKQKSYHSLLPLFSDIYKDTIDYVTYSITYDRRYS